MQVDAVPVVANSGRRRGAGRAGALGAPLERVVVDELARHRVVAVALDLGAERPDHLRVAVVAALADVDVAAGELQRRVGLQARHRLGDRLLEGERHDLHQAADATTRITRMISSAWLRSIMSCVSFIVGSSRRGPAGRGNRRLDGLAGGDGLRHVPGHDQHAAEVEHAAEQADGVERIGRLHALDEGVGERAVGAHRAPHQALHHAGDPHRGDVEHDADGRDPEVQR